MRKFFILLVTLLLFGVGFSVRAEDADTPINVFTLKNGHKLIIKEVHANPIVTIDTWVKTGTADETPEINGVSHFLEHLMFKGTPNYKNGEIEGILEAKGARVNAATSKEFTHYHVTIASDFFETALKLHAEMMQNPAIPVEELEKERKVVQEEIRRANDDPKRILIMNFFELMFPEHTYKMDTLGPHDVIETISREKIFEYYHKRYTPCNMATVIVGDVDTNKVVSLMGEYFNSDKCPGNCKIIGKKGEISPEKTTEKISRGNYKSGYAIWGYKGVPITNIKESYALDIAADILGGGRTSRLYQELKEEKGLVSDISASHYSLKESSTFIVSADFEPEKYDRVKKAVFEEINKMVSEPVTEDELNRVKKVAKRDFIYGNESVESIANSLGYTDVLYGSVKPYDRHLEYIENVTIRDIQEVVKKYLKPEKLVVSVLLPEETEVSNVITDTETIKESTRSVLKNGMTLITTENASNDIISMSVFMKGGIYAEPVPGTANILAKTLMFGTKGRPYLELLKEIEGLGISISPSAGNDYFEIKLKSTKSDFNRAFDILADIIQNPRFEEKYLEKNKNDLLVDIKKSRDYPVSIASENFIHLLYNEHPYGNVGKILEQEVPSITKNDVISYWEETFIPENMVVSVSGDIGHSDMAYKLQENFLASGKELPELVYNDEFSPLTEKKEIFSDKKSEAAWIFMGWPVGNVTDNKELATLRVMESYLSNGLSSRLHKKFREEQGLAYRVGCSYSPKLDKGHFVLYIGTAPKNIELVKGKFLNEIELLKTTPLTKEELENSKSKLIGSFALSQETNQSKAYLLGVFEIIDKEFGFNYDFPDLINEVTSEDILEVANKYFSKPYALSITAPEASKKK